MPLIDARQLIGKTFYLTKPINVYKVLDINNFGDNAKKTGTLNKGQFFIMDSYLLPAEQTIKYGIKYAKRSDTYFTFFDSQKNYLAVKYFPDGRFSLKKLIEQGTKTVEQEIKEQEEKEKTPIDKATETFSNLFTSAGGMLKTIIYIGVGVFALSYLLPKITKK